MATTVITNEEAATRNGKYVDVDGIRTYYEVTGTGEPVILLHGGLCAAETFDAQTTALAEHFRVYVPERYGHGRTPDIDGAITYENMAQHTIAFRARSASSRRTSSAGAMARSSAYSSRCAGRSWCASSCTSTNT